MSGERAEMSISPVEPSVSRIPSVLARRNAGARKRRGLERLLACESRGRLSDEIGSESEAC